MGGFLAIVIVLGVMAPKNTADFVFTDFNNRSGWDSDGVSWLVGLLSTVYPFLGFVAQAYALFALTHSIATNTRPGTMLPAIYLRRSQIHRETFLSP